MKKKFSAIILALYSLSCTLFLECGALACLYRI